LNQQCACLQRQVTTWRLAPIMNKYRLNTVGVVPAAHACRRARLGAKEVGAVGLPDSLRRCPMGK